ncbi:MAG: hypothetical protein ACNA7W_03340 [Pseudomonadales bacterium]
MLILRFVGGVLVLALIIIGLLVVAARFSDGPIGMVAGGPFTSGEFHLGPDPDWDFVRGLDTVEFQLMKPPRSRTTWILLHDGRIFIPSGYMNSGLGRLWKQWPPHAERDGRALLRVGGAMLYPRQLIRVDANDSSLIEPLVVELNRKYRRSATAADVQSGALWLFELQPR